ncbi:cytidylate kinase [Oceanotoga teriensis]|uniref:Cytidylate kinase n=1 Tax=Oceanotoga teriensis TaxID=515440 RepID=A0AA45HI53_9BACT|nr:(d)CMP kinase [Oceanotoga teriensis]MDO7977433.1 (d)CMP kinase [Oceanotoga teriensis]PWJ89615.1 cytidylate kinase [Oceanotoga teriensis]
MIRIAIDGPAGSGKSTMAKIIANKLKINYLDSGALYRIIGYYCVKNNIDLEDKKSIKDILPQIKIDLKDHKYFLNDEEISEQIRNAESGNYASMVAKVPEVREKINQILRTMSQEMSTVIDGRDIGTVVIPDAEIKIFLTASVEERAKRRYDELSEKGKKVDYKSILEQIIFRDKADSSRSIAPLKPAEEAIKINTTNMDIEEVTKKIIEIIKEKNYGN